jgi:putative pyruvate formate lyase activating enzyme
MPDFKYGESEIALRYSGAPRYVETAKAALREMHRQVGTLMLDERGIAIRGLLIRHLVLPEGLAGTRLVMGFIARELSPDSYVNIMDQYHPCFRAADHPPLNRRLTVAEFSEAVKIAWEEGLRRLEGFP